MTTHRKRERGVAMTLAAIWLTAIIAVAAISIEVSRLTDTATEVQVAADAAALAAAENKAKGGSDPAALTAAQTVAGRNITDGHAPAAGDVIVVVGSYSVASGFSAAPPVPGTSTPAVRATITISNVRYLLATAFGVNTSTTVVKRAVATYGCTGTAQPTAPITVGVCMLQTMTQGQPCNTNGNTLTQAPQGTQNSCWTANATNAPNWFPPECGGGAAPILSVGDTLSGNGLNNGQMVPILNAFKNCVNAGVHDYVVPVITCPIANCNAGTSLGQVVGFATMHINNASDITTNGNTKGVTFTQVCNNDAAGTAGGGTGSATCLGQGNVRLVDDR